jgi:hypothetical protein
MIWFSFLHLLVINSLIGIAESWILQKEGLQNKAWKIVLANYISMIVGFYFIAPYFANLFGYDDFWGANTSLGNYDYNGFFTGIIFSFLATLLIEYPFFKWAIISKEKSDKFNSAFLLANLVTNVLMVFVYLFIIG